MRTRNIPHETDTQSVDTVIEMLPDEHVGHIPEGGMLGVVVLILVCVLSYHVETMQVVVHFKTSCNLAVLSAEPGTLSCFIEDVLILIIKFKGPDCSTIGFVSKISSKFGMEKATRDAGFPYKAINPANASRVLALVFPCKVTRQKTGSGAGYFHIVAQTEPELIDSQNHSSAIMYVCMLPHASHLQV